MKAATISSCLHVTLCIYLSCLLDDVRFLYDGINSAAVSFHVFPLSRLYERNAISVNSLLSVKQIKH